MKKLRYWLIRKLAGSDLILLNGRFHDNQFVGCKDLNQGGLVADNFSTASDCGLNLTVR